ncbi:hypothetical protein Tco_1342239, partial [Tanacetum coccineum]
MRPFGCPVTILNTIDHLRKFDGKADEGFFVGYSVNRSGPNWLFDIDALTKSMNYKPIVAGNQSNGSAGTKACDDAGEEQDKDANDNEKDSNANSTNNINTVSSTVNAASIEDNVVDENIVIECADDPNMPNLEDTSIFGGAYDDE